MSLYKKWITEEGLAKISAWKLDGWTNEEIADEIKVSRATFQRWIDKYPELEEAINRSREVTVEKVRGKLFKRAMGMTITEITEDTYDGKEHVKKVTKEIPPDPTSMVFFLKNMDPEHWRDKQDVNVDGAMPVILAGADDLEE